MRARAGEPLCHPILLDAFPILRTDLTAVSAAKLAGIVRDTLTAFGLDLRKCTMLITDNVDTMSLVAKILGVRHVRCHGHVFSLVANALVESEVMKRAQQLLTSITGYIGHSNPKKASFNTACGVSHKDLSTAGTRWCTVLDALTVLLDHWDAILAWLDTEAVRCSNSRPSAADDEGERSTSALLERARDLMMDKKLYVIIKLTLVVAAGLSLATRLAQATLLSEKFGHNVRKIVERLKTCQSVAGVNALAKDTLSAVERGLLVDADYTELALRVVEAYDKIRHLTNPTTTETADGLAPLSTTELVGLATMFMPKTMASPTWKLPITAERLRELMGWTRGDAEDAVEQLEELQKRIAGMHEKSPACTRRTRATLHSTGQRTCCAPLAAMTSSWRLT